MTREKVSPTKIWLANGAATEWECSRKCGGKKPIEIRSKTLLLRWMTKNALLSHICLHKFIFIRFISAFLFLSSSTFFHSCTISCSSAKCHRIQHYTHNQRNENVNGTDGTMASWPRLYQLIFMHNILNPMSILSRFIFRLKITRMINLKED